MESIIHILILLLGRVLYCSAATRLHASQTQCMQFPWTVLTSASYPCLEGPSSHEASQKCRCHVTTHPPILHHDNPFSPFLGHNMAQGTRHLFGLTRVLFPPRALTSSLFCVQSVSTQHSTEVTLKSLQRLMVGSSPKLSLSTRLCMACLADSWSSLLSALQPHWPF